MTDVARPFANTHRHRPRVGSSPACALIVGLSVMVRPLARKPLNHWGKPSGGMSVRQIIAISGSLLAGSLQADEPIPVVEPRQQLILIVGAAGAEEFAPQFSTWAQRWQDAATRGDVECTTIGLTSSSAETVTPAEPDRDRVLTEVERHSAMSVTEPLWIVYLGHATFDGRTARLNLTGPDLSAEELTESLKAASRPVAAIFCASSSSPFINAISAPGRTIISATKDGNQVQFSHFGDAFSEGIAGLDADINRDGQSSLLEAWLFASRRTAEFYKSAGRLATEHSLLDDNADAKGSRAESFEGDRPASNIEKPDEVDGKLAARLFFVRSAEEQLLTAEERVQRDQLEAKVEALKQQRDELSEADYLKQLEQLLLPLSKLYEAADARKSVP